MKKELETKNSNIVHYYISIGFLGLLVGLGIVFLIEVRNLLLLS